VVHADLRSDGSHRPFLHKVQADDACFKVFRDHGLPRSAPSTRASACEVVELALADAAVPARGSWANGFRGFMERSSCPDRQGPKQHRGCFPKRRPRSMVRHLGLATVEVALLPGRVVRAPHIGALIALCAASAALLASGPGAYRATVDVPMITSAANGGQTTTTGTMDLATGVRHWP
jgi:hypothetical protein